MTGFHAHILGAAAGGGLPQWNCGCLNCNLARENKITPQTQSSLAVSADGVHFGILNASPDIRQQMLANPALHPQSLRHTPVESVLVTNGDIDHIAGLLVLREKQAFSLVMTAAIANILHDNPIFRALDPDFVTPKIIALEELVTLASGLEARLFAVPGKVPLFLENGEPETAKEDEQTVGVELITANTRAYYIPGCAMLTPALKARIQGADLLFFDGTLFCDDEMLQTGTGIKTGRRMGHMSISGPEGSLAALKDLALGQVIYIHINNTNPIWRDGPERQFVLSHPGFQIGADGMEIVR